MRKEKKEVDGKEVEVDRTLDDDSILYLQENYVVTDGIFKDQNIIFDNVTDEWKEFCHETLASRSRSTSRSRSSTPSRPRPRRRTARRPLSRRRKPRFGGVFASGAGRLPGMTHPLVLGIETSCDDTACAVLDGDGRVLSSVVSSQLAAHRPYGGVVPEIASREHLANWPAVSERGARRGRASA